ncbi:MAG: MOSC domain-containing protein [Solirubrobacteraceae bacterium]
MVVTALSLTPVKGTRLRSVDHIRLEPEGVRGNRRFYLIDERDRLANGKRLGALTTIVSDYDDAARRLSLRFPDGRLVEDAITVGDLIQTRFYSHRARGRIVGGPFSGAVSDHVGEPLRLVEAVESGGAVDRGAAGVASLISSASLARLAEVAERPTVDARRFRMLIEFDGVAAHAEDAWAGRQVTVGDAVIAVKGHVGRCLITSRDPDSGEVDLPTLDLLKGSRGDEDSTEPIPFGIYGSVERAGDLRVGDQLAVAES